MLGRQLSLGASGKIPVISLRPWFDGSARQQVVDQVSSACRNIGFFAIVDHGIDNAVINDAFKSSRSFFDRPGDEKRKSNMTKDYPYGYEAEETLSSSYGTKLNAPDWKETFTVPNFKIKQAKWPENDKRFKKDMSLYFEEMGELASNLMRIFALSLNLPELWFEDKIDKHNSALRLLNYPEQTHDPLPGQMRASEHTDYGSLTILAIEDLLGGLQVKNVDGTWQDFPVPKKASDMFAINLGDLMARWTNDKWKSTPHRVMNSPKGNSSRRLSIAFFHNPNEDAMIKCIPSCMSKNQPAKYPPITAGEHLYSKHFKAMDMDDK